MKYFSKSTVIGILLSSSAGSICLAAPVDGKSLSKKEKAWFYNKLNTPSETMNRDTLNCSNFAKHMYSNEKPGQDSRPSDYGVVGEAMKGIMSKAPLRAYVDDCMMSLGYKRFETADPNLKSFQRRYEMMSLQEKDELSGDVNPIGATRTRRAILTIQQTSLHAH